MRKNSIKNTRINEEVQHALSEIIRDKVKDPRVAKMTSVIACDVAPDLKTAKVYISVLGDEEEEARTLEGLKKSAGFIRHELATTVNLRNTPEIFFHADHSISYGVHMSHLIDEVNKDLPREEEAD